MIRLDILSAHKLGTSRERAKKLIRAGNVSVDGVIQTIPKFQVEESAVITCFGDLTPENSQILPNHEIQLDIEYEDEHLLVINKQKDLMVHEGTSENYKTVVNALIAKYGDTFQEVGSPFRPGIVHRIDKNTTGLMIIAKTQSAYQLLSQMIFNREITRKYLAVCFGTPRLMAGTISANIGTNPQDRTKQKIMQVGGRIAITHYKVLETIACNGVFASKTQPDANQDENEHDTINTATQSFEKQIALSMVECTLETGRTHQIRVHLAHIGHPIVGDETYTKKTLQGFNFQLLHAYKLEFTHPITGEKLSLIQSQPLKNIALNLGFACNF